MSGDAPSADVAPQAIPFHQPKDLLRWLGIALAVAGWYVSLRLLQVSLGATDPDPFLAAVCPVGSGNQAGGSDCQAVLMSRQAYCQVLGLKLPISALGMGYFAAVGLWYLLVGPPTRAGRKWHLLIVVLAVAGAICSLRFMWIMHAVLHRWCLGCVIAHGINAGLLAVTIAAYPWREPAAPVAAHPSGRLALAGTVAIFWALVAHVGLVLMILFSAVLIERTKAYSAVLDDPAYLRWDYERQRVLTIPMDADASFEGDPAAPNTVVVFSDVQCPRCRELHATLEELLRKFPGRLRVTLRHYPGDRSCNPYAAPGSSHAMACRAARGVEAARAVSGPEAARRFQQLLWTRSVALDGAGGGPADDALLADWAAELDIDRVAFLGAVEGSSAYERVRADIELGRRLGVTELPTVYLNGKLFRNPQRLAAWEAVLMDEPPATAPTSAPGE